MNQKNQMRKVYLQKRDRLSPAEVGVRSKAIRNTLYIMKEYKTSETVFIYINMKSEVETVPIIHDAWQKGKRVAVPVVVKELRKMFFVEIKSLDCLKKSKFGVMEPEWCEELTIPSDDKTLIITPGLAFDQRNYRLGYGGGYYDKFFGENKCLAKIGLAYDFQLISELPTESFDIPVDYVVTDGYVSR